MEVKFSNVFFERSVVFTSVTSLLFTVISVFTNLTVKSRQVFNGAVLILYAAAAILSLIFFLIFNNFFDSKSKSANHFRLFIFSMLFVGVGCVFLRGYVNPVALILVSIAEFFLYSVIFPPFYYYSDFEDQCAGKSGEKIAKDLYKDKFIGEDFLQHQKSTVFLFIVIQIFTLVFLCALPFITYSKSILTYIFAILFYISSFYAIFLLTIYKKEVYYAFMGFESQWNHRPNILKASVIILAICIFTSTLLASNKALIKIDFKQSKIIFIENRPPKQYKQQPIPYTEPIEQPDFEGMFVEQKPMPHLEIIFKVLEILGITLIALGFLLFLTKPFVSGSFFSYMREHRVKDFFREFVTNFKEMLSNIFHKTRKKEAYAKTDAELLKKNIENFLKSAKKSKEKKAELDRLTTLFMKVIVWGEKHAIVYSSNLAPMEYSIKIADYLRSNAEAANVDTVLLTGRLFEKSLYSETLLTAEEEAEYKNAVSVIISME